jgi:hypothetical protein
MIKKRELHNTQRITTDASPVVGIYETESEVGGVFGARGRGWPSTILTKFHNFQVSQFHNLQVSKSSVSKSRSAKYFYKISHVLLLSDTI